MPKRILIADDGAPVREVLRAFFEARTNYEVCGEATDGADAIEKARELKPDLILLDLAMPLMNGAEAASVLHGMMPQVPIVLYSMYDESLGRSLASTLGVSAVISKPDGVGKLVECVRGLLEPAVVDEQKPSAPPLTNQNIVNN
jgi:two-component system, chemotaxis family, chemotaxis protein CheY